MYRSRLSNNILIIAESLYGDIISVVGHVCRNVRYPVIPPLAASSSATRVQTPALT